MAEEDESVFDRILKRQESEAEEPEEPEEASPDSDAEQPEPDAEQPKSVFQRISERRYEASTPEAPDVSPSTALERIGAVRETERLEDGTYRIRKRRNILDPTETVGLSSEPVATEQQAPERPSNIWADDAKPVWVEDWGDWAWTYKAPDDAPNAGTQYTWDTAGNVVATPERIREVRNVQMRSERREQRPAWWDAEEEEAAVSYVHAVATTRNVPITNEDGSPRDLLDLTQDVYRSYLTSEQDRNAYLKKINESMRTGVEPEYTEADTRVQKELLEGAAFVDRVFPTKETRGAREQVEARQNIRLADDLTQMLQNASNNDQLREAIQSFNENQRSKNRSRRETEELINELHYGVTDDPSLGQRISRAAFGTPIRGVSELVGLLPEAPSADEAAQSVTDEFVSAYDAHLKRQASSDRISQLTPEDHNESPYIVDIGDEARAVLSGFTDSWVKNRDSATWAPVTHDIVDYMSDEEKVYFDRAFPPMISDIASVAIVREIAEQGEVATPARLAAYAQRYTRSANDLALLVAKHVPVSEQLQVAQYNAPSAYKASQEIASSPTEQRTLSDNEAILLLKGDPAYFEAQGLPEEFKDATIRDRVAWLTLRKNVDPRVTDEELVEQWRTTSEGKAIVGGLQSRFNRFKRVLEYNQDAAPPEIDGPAALVDAPTFVASAESNAVTRQQYNRELDAYRSEARRFLKRTGQTVSKQKVDAIAWGMMTATIPNSLRVMSEVVQAPEVEAQPQSEFTPDMLSQETQDLSSPMPAERPADTLEARENALAGLRSLGSMFEDTTEASSPFMEGADALTARQFNEKYADVLPFPARHEYTQESILKTTGVEGYYLRKALRDIHSSGIGLDPAVVYQRAVFYYNQDPQQISYKAAATAQREQLNFTARRARLAEMRRKTDSVRINWVTTASGQTQVETPLFYQRLLTVVRNETPWQEWKKNNEQPGLSERDLYQVYDEQMRSEAQSLLADKILASQGTSFYMPFSDRTVAQMAENAIPSWASPLRILYASLVPVINTNDALDPGWATGGRPLTYGDLKQDHFLWQVFNVLPTNYLAVGARYGVGEMFDPSQEALTDIAGGLNTFTAFGDIQDVFTNMYSGVGLPEGVAEELAFWTGVGGVGYFAFKEPDAVIGAMAGVRALSGIRKSGKNALRAGEEVAGALSRFAEESAAAGDDLVAKEAALGELMQALGQRAGAQQHWYQEAGQSLAQIWGDDLHKLDGVIGLDTNHNLVQTLRGLSDQRASAEQLRDSLLRKLQDADISDEVKAGIQQDAFVAEARAAQFRAIEAEVDHSILKLRKNQLAALLGEEDVTKRIIEDGITIFDQVYRGQKGLDQLIEEAADLQRRIEIQELNLGQSLQAIVPRSPMWARRPRQAHSVYTPQADEAIRGVGEVRYPVRIIEQPLDESPMFRLGRRPGFDRGFDDFGILRPSHDTLSNVAFRLRNSRKLEVKLEAEMQASLREFSMTADEVEKARRTLDEIIAGAAAKGGNVEFRARAAKLFAKHQQKVARLMDEVSSNPDAAKSLIAEYRRFQIEHRKMVEEYALVDKNVRNTLLDMASERQRLQALYVKMRELAVKNEKRFAEMSSELTRASRVEDKAWVESLLARRKELKKDRETLERVQRIYGDQSDIAASERRLNEAKARYDDLSLKVLKDESEEGFRFRLNFRKEAARLEAKKNKALDEIKTWNNTEWMPLAYRQLEATAEDLAKQMREEIKLIKAKFAEKVASASTKLSANLDELVTEIPTDELRAHAQNIRAQLELMLPPEQAAAVWNTTFILPAKAFARNTGRLWEEWLYTNVKEVIGKGRTWSERLADGAREGRILLQTAEQGDAPIFYSQLRDVVLPRIFDGRSAVPLQELKSRLYKLKADGNIVPKSVKVAGKQESVSLDELRWTGIKNFLDDLEVKNGARFRVTHEMMEEYLETHSVKVKTHTKTNESYADADEYRMEGGNHRNGRTFHIQWANRPEEIGDFRPFRRDKADRSHWNYEDHIGWARTTVRELRVVDPATNDEGIKTFLFIDEVQSDWMQRAGKSGMEPFSMEPFRPIVARLLEALDDSVSEAERVRRLDDFLRRYPSGFIDEAISPVRKVLLESAPSAERVQTGAAAGARRKLNDYLAAYSDETLPDAMIKIKFQKDRTTGFTNAELEMYELRSMDESFFKTTKLPYIGTVPYASDLRPQDDRIYNAFRSATTGLEELAEAIPSSGRINNGVFFDLKEAVKFIRNYEAARAKRELDIDRIMSGIDDPYLARGGGRNTALREYLRPAEGYSEHVMAVLADFIHSTLKQMPDEMRAAANVRSLTASEKGLLDTWFDVFRVNTDLPGTYRRGLSAENRKLNSKSLELLPYYNIVTNNGRLSGSFNEIGGLGNKPEGFALPDAVHEGLWRLNRRVLSGREAAGPMLKTWKDVVIKRLIRQALDDGFDGIAFSPSYGTSAASGGFWAGIDAHTNIMIKSTQRYTNKTWSTADDPIEWTSARFLEDDLTGRVDDVRLGRRDESGQTNAGQKVKPAVPEDAWMAEIISDLPFTAGGRPIRGLTWQEHDRKYGEYFLRLLRRSLPEGSKEKVDELYDFITKNNEAGYVHELNASTFDFHKLSEDARLGHENRILDFVDDLSSNEIMDQLYGANWAESALARQWQKNLNNVIFHLANVHETTNVGRKITYLLEPLNTVDVMLFNKAIKESSRTQRLLQRDSLTMGIKGATEFLDDGRAIIYGFSQADISTIIHEMGHVIRRTLSRDQQLAIRRWIASSTDTPVEKTVNEFGEWTVESEEAFARGFERMFAPKPLKQTFDVADMDAATADAFRTVRTFMSKVYDDLDKRRILGDALTPEAKRTMNEVMGLNQRIDILELYGPGRRISRTLFNARVQNVLDSALGKDTPHAVANLFLKDLESMLGGAEADILRRLTSHSAGDVVIDGQDLQVLYGLLDEMPEFIKRYHIDKAGLRGGAEMMNILGNKFLQNLRNTRPGVIAKTIRKTQQFFDPEGTRWGAMKEEVIELTKAHANMQRQATDELNILLRSHRTPDTFKKVMLDYVDGQVPVRTPNGYTVFNQGPLTLYRHLQKYIEDHPYYSPERRANVEAALAKAEREAEAAGKRLSNNEKLRIREEFEQAGDLSAKTETLRALARIFVQNTERYPIGGAAAMDLEEVAYKLLTGKVNQKVVFKSLKTKDGAPLSIRLGVETGETFGGKTIFLKPANSMAEFLEEMKKAHKVVTNYRHRMPGTVYKSTDPMVGEMPAVAPMHEALNIAVQIAGHSKIMNETINDYRKIFGLLTEEEAFKINRMIEDPHAAIDALDTIGSRYIALQRTSGARRTRMETRHGQLVELSRKMVSVAKTTDGQAVFMPYDLARQFDATMTALIKDLDAITPEGAMKAGVPVLDAGTRFARGYLSWWRQSVLTGLLLPNPRYWVNNIVGDMSQMITSIGVGPASKLSFQNMFSNIEIGRFKPHTYLLKKTEELQGTPVLGSMMNALFNPRLHNVWSGKNGVMILPNGRQLPYAQLRDWLVKDGILDSFTQAELATQMRKIMEKQKWWTSGVDKLRNWQFDIQAHATMVQQRQRTALYLDLLERGYSRKEAKKLTLEALYDWRNSLGQAEMNSVTMLFLPFWRFHKLAMKQMGVSLFEAYTMPGKEYWKKLATGRTKWTRMRGQAQIVNNIPHIVSPAEREDWTAHEGRLNLMARLFTPPWAGRLHSWGVPGRLNKAEWDWMRDNLGHAQSFDRAGYRIWYGPQLTATHQLQIFNSFFTLFTAGTAKGIGWAKHGDTGHYLADGWERGVIEPWTGMMHRPFQAFVTSQLKGLGLDPGFVPGRFIPHQGKLTAGERSIFNFIDRTLGGDTVFSVEDQQDEQGRYNANPVLTKLWKEVPFFGLQLMGVIDKSQRALAFADAKFPDDDWLQFWYGFAYFTGAWTGIAKPYEFALDKNYAQWVQSLRESVGIAEIPLKNIQTDFDFKYRPHK